MNRAQSDIEQRREALQRIRGDRSKRALSKSAGVAYSTMLRLIEGDNPPKIAAFDKLHVLPGYSSALADVKQEQRRAIPANVEDTINRLIDVLGEEGLDQLAFTAEGLARLVGGRNVASNMRGHLKEMQAVARQMAGPERETKKDSK